MSDFSPNHGVSEGDYQELRLALVLNGGVSLAIWISGVVREIDRLVRSDSTYGALLELTAAHARVDVISGASAGGVNGVMLALGLTRGVALDLLRALWLDHADFDALLRDPFEKEPPSLLDGTYFKERLRSALQQIHERGSIQPAEQVPIDLTVTVTLLNGDKKRMPDDFGNLIEEVDHRGQIRFRRGRAQGKDAFADPRIIDRLAMAARATAGFPGAFEPLFCPVGAEPPGAVDMKGFASFPSSRFLVDGGTLDNKPMEWAIEAIFRQRSLNEVRRVLAYVIPDPGETTTDQPDDPASSPPVGHVVAASLATMPRVETVSAQLAQILEHNRLVQEKRDTRITLAEPGYDALYDLARGLFRVYRQQRCQERVEHIVTAVMAGFGEHEQRAGAHPSVGRRGREWLSDELMEKAKSWFPEQLPARGQVPDDASWIWDTPMLEAMAELALYVLDRALRCIPVTDAAAPADQESPRATLKRLHARAYDAIDRIPSSRSDEQALWNKHGQALAAAGAFERASSELETLVKDAFGTKAPPALGQLARTLAGLLAEAASVARPLVAQPRAALPPQAREHAKDLSLLLAYLAPPDHSTPELVLARALALQVVQLAVDGKREARDQFIELLQIDANTRGPFGNVAKAKHKLAGMGLSHFGAFYKRPWRANDWMHGRLDGNARLVRVLLDPGRLRRLYHDNPRVQGSAAAHVAGLLEQLAVPQAGADRDFLAAQWDRGQIERELAFLDNPAAPTPESLPASVQAMVRRMHLEILRQELPLLLEEQDADQRHARAPVRPVQDQGRAASPAVAAAESPPVEIVTRFNRHAAQMKGIEADAGSDRFTHLVTRASAVAVSALASQNSGLGPARRGLQVLRMPLLVLYLLVQTALQRGRLYTAIFTVSATIVVLTLILPLALPGELALAAAGVFGALTFLALLRRGILPIAWLILFPLFWIVTVRTEWISKAWKLLKPYL